MTRASCEQTMKREIYLSLIFFVLISLLAACSGNAPSNNSNSNASNAGSNNSVPTNLNPTTKPETATVNDAPTLGPVVQQYYNALKTKDDAALRETLTKDFVARIEKDMKEEKVKGSIAEFVAKEDQYRPEQSVEVRNEKLEGEKRVAELRGGAYKNWTPFAFAKENGKWKFTGGSPDLDNMPKNSNSAK